MKSIERWLNDYYNVLNCNNNYDNKAIKWLEEQKRRVENLEVNSTELKMLQLFGDDIVEDKRLIQWLSTYEELRDCGYELNDLKDVYTSDGRCLFDWVHNQKRYYKKGLLSDAKIRKLEELGIQWVILTRDPNKEHKMTWYQYYKLCQKHYEKYGHIILPDYYIYEGVNIGEWLKTQKRNYAMGDKTKLDDIKIQKLNAIGMCWDNYPQAYWKFFITTIKGFKENGGTHMNIDTTYNKIPIGKEFVKVRKMYQDGKLNENQLRDLRKLGIKF